MIMTLGVDPKTYVQSVLTGSVVLRTHNLYELVFLHEEYGSIPSPSCPHDVAVTFQNAWLNLPRR